MRRIWGSFISAAVVSLLVVLVAAFQWSIIDRITPFLFGPLHDFVWLSFLVVAIFSLVCAAKFRKIGTTALLPAALQALALAVVVFVPFTNIWLALDFALYEKERLDVVKKIYSGELLPNVSHNASIIALGERYPLISMGGNEVIVEEHGGQKYILFYTFRGILDNYSGFLHVPPGGDPKSFSDLYEDHSTQIVPWRDEWFYVSHH